jgi:hypothetical protein
MSFAEFSSSDSYFIGVDLGQSIDPTAIAVVRVTATERPIFQVGYLERLPLHMPYPGVCWKVRSLLGNPLLRGRSEVVLDLTGVGRPVNDLFTDQGVFATGVTITAGLDEVEVEKGRFFHVPKLTLVSRVQSLLHDGRLQIQKDLPDTPALIAELQDFRATVTDSGRWTFGARSGQHDDLVLALALACWRGHNSGMAVWRRLGGGNARPTSESTDDLKPGPDEVIVTIRVRVWLYGSNRWLEPGRRVMSEADAALYAEHLA